MSGAGSYMLKARKHVGVFLAFLLVVTIAPIALLLEAAPAQAAVTSSDTALTTSGSQFAESPAQLIPSSGDFTFQAWVYPNSGIQNFAMIASQGTSTTRFYLQSVNNQLNWTYGSASAFAGYMRAGQWTHVSFTYSATTGVNIYLNGQQSYSWSGKLSGVGPGLHVGAWAADENNNNYRWKGDLDEIRVYNSARTATEVVSDMHSYANTAHPNLTAYYDFNDQSLTNKDTVSKVANSDLTSTGTLAWQKIAQETTVNNQKYITFSRTFITADGGWSVPAGAQTINAIVVAGGGGGGSRHGGGGGGGGLLSVQNAPISAGKTLTVKVGAGGLGGRNAANGARGQQSTLTGADLATLNPVGGGGGGGGCNVGVSGGSGGGGGACQAAGGAGTPNQGNAGGAGRTHYYNNGTGDENWQGGGGGGAGQTGGTAGFNSVGRGGAGKAVSWFTQSVQSVIKGGEYHAGGTYKTNGSSYTAGVYFAAGGSGGGGGFISYPSPGPGGGGTSNEGFGMANTGGGGGGGTRSGSWGGDGGSGVVILSYTTVPNTPTALRAVALDDTRVNLTWTAPTVNGAILSDYVIEQSTDNTNWTVVPDAVTVATNFTVTGLTQNTQYYFRIAAKNDTSTGAKTASVSATTWIKIIDASGQCVQYVSSLVDVTAVLSGDSCVVTFAGSTQWAVPQGVTKLDTFVVGGGGGGGAQAGFGGGGGSVASQQINLSSSQISDLTVTVGAGGTGGTATGTPATAGGQSILRGIFGLNEFTVTSPGGLAGSASTSTVTAPAPAQAGVPTFAVQGSLITESSRTKTAGGLGGAGRAWTPYDAETSSVGFLGSGGYSPTSIFTGDFGGGGGGGPVSWYEKKTTVPINDATGKTPSEEGWTPTYEDVFTDTPVVSTSGRGVKGGGTSAFAATAGTYTLATAGVALSGGGGGAGTYSSATTKEANGAAGGSGVVFIKYPLVSPPLLTTSPVDATRVGGESVSFTATFGSTASEIRWQKSITGGTSWADIADTTTLNASSATYTFDTQTSMSGDRYRAVAKNINGVATAETVSGSAILTVTANSQTLPVGGKCDGTTTTNGLTTTAGHGKVFYIDTGQGQEIDAGYLAYTVKSETSRNDLWVEISGFTGGIMSLADPSTQATPLGAVSAEGTGTAFFMVKATSATTVAQSHVIRVFDQKPSIGSPQPLYECSFSFTRVDETIKAAANKVDGVTTTTVTSIGSAWTMTVNGDSGTIGAGNDIDGRMFWLIPAARSSWPVSGVRLEKTELKMYSDASRTAQLGSTHVNTLRINDANGLDAKTRQFWTAIYTFRIIGPAASAVPIIPVAMISSGTQIKHTDVSSVNGGTLNLADPPPPISLTVNKNVSPVADVRSDGTTRFNYEIVMENTGPNELAIDEVIDTPDLKAAYVAGTAKYSTATDPTETDFINLRDPGTIGTSSSIAFTGPLTVPANSTRKITYSMAIETCKVGQSFTLQNTAIARAGTLTIGSGSATQSVVTVNASCGSDQLFVFEEDVALPPEVITSAASLVTTTSATISGSLDPNGDAGNNVRFNYSKSPTLSGSPAPVAVDLADTTNATASYGVSAPLTGLTPSTTYYYRLEVLDGDVWKLGEILSFTTDALVATPSVATNETTLVSTTTALFNGTIDPNQVAGGAKVIFEFAASAVCPPTGTLSSTGFLQVENQLLAQEDAVFTGASSTYVSFEQSGLTAGTSYCVRTVGVYDSASRTEGSWVQFSTSPAPELPDKSPQTISWNTGTDALPAGGTTTVQAFADSTLAVTYTSVDPLICTVHPTTGVVTAVATSGNCAITATQAGNADFYAAEPQTVNFAISPPVITTTSLQTGTYASAYSQTIAAAGGNGTHSDWKIVSGELPPGLSLDETTGIISGTPTLAGIFVIYVTVQSNGITSDVRPLTVTINKVALTVAAPSFELTFGDPVPMTRPIYDETEFINPDTSEVISASYNVAPTCSTNYVQGTNAGVSTVFTKCADGWATNYSFIYLIGSIDIAPLELEIKALDAAKRNDVSGTETTVVADPSFRYSVSPSLPAGQTMADVLTAEPTFTRTGSGTAVGTYPTANLAGKEVPGDYAITPTGTQKVSYTAPEEVNGATVTVNKYNYTVTFVAGTLAISQKIVPQLNITTPKSIEYGTDLTGLLNATATHNGATIAGTYTYTYVNAEGNSVTVNDSTLLPAGNYSITVTFTPTNQTLYFGPITGVLNISVEPFALKVFALDSAKQNLISGSNRIVSQDPNLMYYLGRPLPVGHTLTDVFPNGVDVSRELSGVPAGTYQLSNSTIGASEAKGTYDITAFGSRASNFSITYVPAAFVITDKIVPEVGATDATMMERQTIGTRLNATGTHQNDAVAGSFEYSYFDSEGEPRVVTSFSTLPRGLYSIRVKFTPNDTSKYYGPVFSVMMLTVNPYVAPPPPDAPNPQPGSGNTPQQSNPGNTPQQVNPGETTPNDDPAPTPSRNTPSGNSSSDGPYTSVLPTIPGLSALLDYLSSLIRGPGSSNGQDSAGGLSSANSGSNLFDIAELIPSGTTVDFGNGAVDLSAENISEFNNSSGNATRSLSEMASEKLIGFYPPGSAVRVEVIGARTGARFVVANVDAIDQAVLMSAITNSIAAQESDFFAIQNVTTGIAPQVPEMWNRSERTAINQFFNAAGLAEPQSLADVDINGVMNWIEIEASASSYVPGSVVYLTLTSSPLVIASAEVDEQGNVDVAGSMPVELLGSGEHRIRLVGTRLLDGIEVDNAGEVQVTSGTLDEIRRFDLGTQATISMVGTNEAGGGHLALRVIPLEASAPWWTIFLLSLLGLVMIVLRRRGSLNLVSRRVLGVGVIVLATLPAVILGWISTVTQVLWVGLAVGIALSLVTWFLPQNRKRNDDESQSTGF